MKNLVVDRKVNISADFTAEDWQLYCDQEESEEVAEKLNKRLEFLVNNGFSAEDVHRNMWRMMNEYSNFGASDSEPIRFLNNILNKIYIKEYC